MEILQNEVAISKLEALSINKEGILQYANRICEYCNAKFNIEKKGIFYWCGCER